MPKIIITSKNILKKRIFFASKLYNSIFKIEKNNLSTFNFLNTLSPTLFKKYRK